MKIEKGNTRYVGQELWRVKRCNIKQITNMSI